MSIHDRITKTMGEIKEKILVTEKFEDPNTLGENIESYLSSSLIPKRKTSEYLKSATGWIYGCVGVIADEVAGIDLALKQTKNNEEVEIEDHAALDVIYRANNAMTRFDLIQTTFQYLELTGEAPWFISFKNKKPDSIVLLRPDRLTVKPGKDGEMIGGYKYKVYNDSGFKEIDLEPFEVVPLKYIDPDQPLRGKGPLQAAASTIDLDDYSERWNSQFFRNSATPHAAFSTDKALAKDVRNRLQQKIKDNYQGIENSHKTMILEGGLKFQSMSLTQKDMDFIEQQKFSRDKIMAIFRVPKSALGLTEDVNRANAEATDYVFAKRTIKPKMIRFVEQLNEFFLPLFPNTEKLYFDFTDPVPENVDQLIKRAESGVGSGYMTLNEARELTGLDPIEGGDILRDPTSFQPVQGDDNQNLSFTRSKTKKPSRKNKHYLNARGRSKKEKDQKKAIIEKTVYEAVTPIVLNYLKQKAGNKRKAELNPFKGDTPEAVKAAKYSFQEKQLNVADEFEPKVIKKLNGVFEAQKNIILRGLDGGDKMKLNQSTEVEIYLKALRPVMTDLMREQARLAFQIIGVQRSYEDKKAQTFLQRLEEYFRVRTFRFATEVTKETNSKLAAQFALATEAGESIPQIKKRVSELFDNMEGYRSERIARTETIRSSNFATEEAYKESGIVEAKEWLTTKDERTDEECNDLDGKIIPLGKNFQNKRDNGYEAVQFPPIHVNCRCTLLPVVSA